MPVKIARANVTPRRQPSQYSCVTTSLAMAMQALGLPAEEVRTDRVNDVLGAMPLHGASWEQAAGAASHFGCRTTLVIPSTLRQVRAWTDVGIPVLIGWNTGNEWSHASLVVDVDDTHVHVADPNLPNPDTLMWVGTHDEFYARWWEKSAQGYKIRRPAMAVEREITPEGKQVMASSTSKHVASMSRHCFYYMASNDKWYMELADEEYGERRDSDTWGPFLSFEAARDFCDKFPNPGMHSMDDSGLKPPPTRSPNGNPVQSPHSHWSVSRWASAARKASLLPEGHPSRYYFSVLGEGPESYRTVERELPTLLRKAGWTRAEVHDELRNEHEDFRPDPTTSKWAAAPPKENRNMKHSRTAAMDRVGDTVSTHEGADTIIREKPRDPGRTEYGKEFVTQIMRYPGYGTHHNREDAVEKGRSRKEKHKRNWNDREASPERVAARFNQGEE